MNKLKAATIATLGSVVVINHFWGGGTVAALDKMVARIDRRRRVWKSKRAVCRILRDAEWLETAEPRVFERLPNALGAEDLTRWATPAQEVYKAAT